jgi:hypothetical protein
MKSKITTMLTIALLAIMFVSCSKDDKDSEEAPKTSSDGFTWKENGGPTVQIATATFSTQYKTIKAYSGTTLVFEINLSGTTPATYTLNTNNVITYTKVSPFFIPTSGNVIISSNANSKVSGTFQGTGTTTAGISSVSGTFTNITLVP